MGRSPSSSSASASSCDEIGLKRGPWTPQEDHKLVAFITQHGHRSWRALPKLAGLNRCGKSCRLRWTNYLRPDIKRGKFSQEEQQIIINLHSILGNKWSVIASHLPGRTDNEIKNLWNTHLKKRLMNMGFDPITHMPITTHNSYTTLSAHHRLLPPLEHQVEAFQMLALHEYLHHLLEHPSSSFTPTFQPLQYDQNMFVPFAHLPDLKFCEEASGDPTAAAVYGSQTGASSWVSSSAPPPLPPPMEANSEPDAQIFEDYSLFNEIHP